MDSKETNNRNFRLAPFIAAIICFVLPFIHISCAGEKAMTLSGIQLVTGAQIQEPRINQFTGAIETKTDLLKGEPLIILALLSAISGAGFVFLKGENGQKWPAAVGGAGFIFMLVAKGHFDNEVLQRGKGAVSIEYGTGFVLVCVCLLGGAVLAGQQYLQGKKTEPTNANGALPPPPPPPPPPPQTPPPPTAPAPPTPPGELKATPASPVLLFYYADNQAQPKGPLSFAELLVLERSEVIKPDTNIIREGAAEWSVWAAIKTEQ